MDPKQRRPLATMKAAEVAAGVLSLWAAVAVTAAVMGFIEFSELAEKKTPLMIGSFFLIFNYIAKIYGAFEDDLS